jgi:hypothetical protein
MIGNIKIERDLELEFSVSDIKSNIERIIPLGIYTKHSQNDVFNTYRISKMDGFEIVSFNVTIKKIDDNKSNLKLDCIENVRNSGHEAIVNRILDNFLDRLGKSLTGLGDEEIKLASNKGCFGLVLLLLLASTWFVV